MSKILRIINIVAIVILVLFFVSILLLPWPANIIIGGLISVSFILVIISDRQAKKRKQAAEESDSLKDEIGSRTNIIPGQ